MYIYRKVFLVLSIGFLVGGCYEDTAEITLHSDGSGSVRQKFVLSERLLVAAESGRSASGVPETNKDALIKKIGKSIAITSITQNDASDGSRTIELEGTFDTPEQFFLSDYCTEQMNLRLSPNENDKAAIYCDMSYSGDVELELAQLYGLAKGLYIRRIIHLPNEIERTNGTIEDKSKTVSWSTDLRNKEALAKTEKFIEGPDQGEGFAVFDAANLGFAVPLKIPQTVDTAETSRQGESSEQNSGTSGLTAKVTHIEISKRKSADNNKVPEITDFKIGLELNWDQDHCPVRYSQPVLLNILDDLNNNLAEEKKSSLSLRDVSSIDERRMKKEMTVNARYPANNARAIKHIEGYVEVTTKIYKEKIVVDNIRQLIGKQPVGNEILDKLHFKIVNIDDSSITIEIDGGKDAISSLTLIDKDDSALKWYESGGSGNRFQYGFRKDISSANKCELEVIVSEDKIKVPFSLDNISLP